MIMELNDIQKEFINKKLNALSKSKFRSSFHLRKYMYDYIDKQSIEIIEKHHNQKKIMGANLSTLLNFLISQIILTLIDF